MKRIIKILWSAVITAALIFILIMFTANTDAMIWRAFSIIMPFIGIAFWGALILTVIDFIRSKKQ